MQERKVVGSNLFSFKNINSTLVELENKENTCIQMGQTKKQILKSKFDYNKWMIAIR